MSNFLPTSGFKCIDPKEFELNKYTSNSLKGCVLEVYLNYPIELQELHNDYPLAPDKIEVKKEILSDYKLKIADLYNILIDNLKKLVRNLFLSKAWGSSWELKNLLETWIETKKKKKNASCIRIQLITMVKTIHWIQQSKKNICRK